MKINLKYVTSKENICLLNLVFSYLKFYLKAIFLQAGTNNGIKLTTSSAQVLSSLIARNFPYL